MQQFILTCGPHLGGHFVTLKFRDASNVEVGQKIKGTLRDAY